MQQPITPLAPKRRQRGVTLIESLVAIVVAALGILGILGTQMRTLTDTQTTVRRAQAIRLIEDLSERIRVNPSTLSNLSTYTSGFNEQPTPDGCANDDCDPSALATHDLGIWKQNVANTLPMGKASIFLPPGEAADADRRHLGVMISWRENEIDISDSDDQKLYKDNIDATKVHNDDGALTSGTGTGAGAIACPTGSTCHLQYLPIATRCAPHFNATVVPNIQYYCPGY